jgi:hypothetical protein
MLFPGTAERVAALRPDAKLLYIVRHPLDRILSHRLHSAAEGSAMPPLAETLERWPHFVDSSLYWKVEAYRCCYPDGRILILFFEDFVDRPQEVMSRCYEFLEVDPKLTRSGSVRGESRVGAEAGRRSSAPDIAACPSRPASKGIATGAERQLMSMLRKPLPDWPDRLRRGVAAKVKPDAEALLALGGLRGLWRNE